jgi:hypothetical protein
MTHTLRRLTAVAVILMTLTAATCNKASVTSAASDVLNSLRDAQPLIERLLPKASGDINEAVTIASKITDAIKVSDSTTAATLLQDLIPVFQNIVNNDLKQLSVAQQTEILTVLALANIGLHFLIDHLQNNAPSLMANTGVKAKALAAFAKEDVWGLRYKRK